MDNLKNFITQIKNDKPDNITKIYFSRKTNNNNSKYITHNPSMSKDVQSELLDTIFPYVDKQLESLKLVDYNPLGVMDGELEHIKTSDIPLFQDFLNSISAENINYEMDSLRIEKIDFYCIEFSYNGKKVYMFRQFQKLKKLRQVFWTRIINNELNAIDNDFLGIDELIDMIAFDEKIYLLNHISLERVFSYRDEFLKKTNEALGEILTKNVINNIEQFADDCRNDIRIMKRFTSIMTKDRLPLFFENYEKVPEIVAELELDLDFDENGKIIYRERSQLFHIINLLSDSYFKSLLAQRTGVAKLEGEI